MEFGFVPEPDVEEFKDVILRKKRPKRAHICELGIDKVVLKYIWENIFGEKWIEGETREEREKMLLNYIKIFKNLGFDTVRLNSDFRFDANIKFPQKVRKGKDTAELSKNERNWVEEKEGMIKTWEDFENYPWPDGEKIDIWPFEFISENLPDSMGILGCLSQGVFEITMFLFGYENLCYLIYDNPELVKAVIDKVGEIILKGYEKLCKMKKLIGFFQGDDMGFKTGLLLPPDFIRKHILPWHRKFSELAHNNNLLYILHSCGNLEEIMEDLIEFVKIDAKHSFEDEIIPVWKFKRKYGERIGVIGGVDVGKLCRFEDGKLRKYVREILDKCGLEGYILGSGNTIANYVPVKNFLIMIEEGHKYKPAPM